MNYSTAVFLINKHVRAILCTYEAEEKASRTMFKTLDDTIRVGDFVTVPTDTRHKMTVCKVVECDVDVDFDSGTQVAWIIGKVDRSAHERTLAEEAQAVQAIKSAETQRKREELRKSMMGNHVETLKALPIYANGDPAPTTPATE